VNKPVQLYYKANVYQNSGVKWDSVNLTLSTANPQEGIQAPMLTPWYLSRYLPPAYTASDGQSSHERVLAYQKPIVDKDKPGSTLLTSKEISALPTTDTK